MTHDEAIKSLLRAKGLIDPLRIARVQRSRAWNEKQFPQPTGRAIGQALPKAAHLAAFGNAVLAAVLFQPFVRH